MMSRLAIAGLAVLALAACGGSGGGGSTGTSSSSASASSNTAGAQAGLPCDPQSSSCWVPQVSSPPQENLLSYKPAQRYSDANALAKALGCTVMPAEGDYTPTAQAVNCETGPATGGVQVFSSLTDEANAASTLQQNGTSNGDDFYYVFGPGWAAGSADGYYSQSKAVQDRVGGELVCFSDGISVDNIPVCSDGK